MFQPNQQQRQMNNRHFPHHQGPYHQQPYQHHPMQHNIRPPHHTPPFQGPNMGMMQQPYNQPSNKASFFKTAFTNESGKFDMGKTVSTVDQVVKTMHQVSPIVKSVGSFFIKK
ncbi:YppG family protein [Halalkalibacter akibai]|uniref:Spore coat protein n=1 Tax=Halalkalibacter akibai (strain ATCC 43226 / DSM 21942 / CIP 109018 / JCM 9157 / 1139) TaxID=1236973 RepID=W4QUI7_HALA3|nr:YppG family protein [Halalkalibacter akibai]GAE35751.1 hypothetical protein JCM9157_2880 [Halalkalibacter akibai JCM 9157]